MCVCVCVCLCDCERVCVCVCVIVNVCVCVCVFVCVSLPSTTHTRKHTCARTHTLTNTQARTTHTHTHTPPHLLTTLTLEVQVRLLVRNPHSEGVSEHIVVLLAENARSVRVRLTRKVVLCTRVIIMLSGMTLFYPNYILTRIVIRGRLLNFHTVENLSIPPGISNLSALLMVKL